MEIEFSNIGDRIIARLKELGIKQIELCRKTGLSTTAISQYCTDKRIPDTASIYKIAHVLNTSIEWILTGEDATIEDLTNEEFVCDGIPLTAAEADLIAMYRLISTEDQKTVFDVTKMKYEQMTGEQVSVYLTYTDTERSQSTARRNDDSAEETA